MTSSDVSVASVGVDGTLLGLRTGTSVIEFRLANGGVVAAAVNVGQADSRRMGILSSELCFGSRPDTADVDSRAR